jgi:hypothetical protein
MKIVGHTLAFGANTPVYSMTNQKRTLLQQVLAKLGQEQLLVHEPVEQKVFEDRYTFEQNEQVLPINVTTNFLKYDDNLKVSLLTSGNEHFGSVARAEYLKGNKQKQIVTFLDGTLLADIDLSTDEQEIYLPSFEQYMPQLDNATPTSSIDDCWLDGCCSFRYNGLPWNPLVKYNWCGRGCGSGTPINPLDTCCQAHDICYGTTESVCSCDKKLIDCASKTDNAGTDRVILAFKLKSMFC